MNTSENNKRIAKNTLLLYFRMLLTMIVSLYTSRVVLNTLGIEDYGIYNVVGGVVAMFSVISGSLSAAITRFITFELGTGNKESLNKVFSSSVTIQIGLALIIVILAETVGVWFLNAKMNIPDGRMLAASWVFQFSLLTFAISLISVPYNASIIAHEKMSAFAYISIFEAASKLGVAFLIAISPIDQLIFYAMLICCIAIIIRLIYGIYCKRNFEECSYHFIYDGSLLKRMFGFAGWNFLGAASWVLSNHGGNIVINLFCGPAVNAARGIATRVTSAVQGFSQNFMTALNPQITKSYASGDRQYQMILIYQGARLSFYMLLLISLPVLLNTHYLLEIWLKVVPEHAVEFVQLSLILSMLESISNPLITAMLATGNIRNYQIIVGGLQMLNLPASYILLRMGCVPEMVLIVAIVISQCCLATRLIMLRGMIRLSAKNYLVKVYANIIIVSLFAAVVPVAFSRVMEENIGNFLLLCLISIMCTVISILYIGCNKQERQFVAYKVKSVISRFLRK
ncbi:lipopolysaccharide biosynthesis protein [Marseilla massiliensis]|uniref:lipopolysaccharide biosynthesis protein n=1 Tax=Marseilla massiliensis TaxID=1841864 RepID=UPI0030C7FAF9